MADERRGVSRVAFRALTWPSRVATLDEEQSLASREGAVDQFLERLGSPLPVDGATVLDVGSGYGALCFRLAEKGATRVVGLEVDPALVEFSRSLVAGRYRHLADRVEFHLAADVSELEVRDLDLVVCQDVLIYIPDLERFVDALATRLKPGGTLAIGMSPLWHSPWGGLIKHTTRVPWAHLAFPEELFTERGHSFHGDRRMTVRHFCSVMRNSGLEERSLDFNVTSPRGPFKRCALVAMHALRKVPPLRELMTFSVYGLWKKPS